MSLGFVQGLWAEFLPFGGALTHQTNPCSFAWAVTDGSVHPAVPGRMSCGGHRQGWSAPPLPAGAVPAPSTAGMRSSAANRQRRAQPPSSLCRLPPAGCRGLWLEREPHGIPKQWDGGSWIPLCTLPNYLRVQGSSQEPAGYGQSPVQHTGMLLRVLPAPGANSSSFLPGSKEAEQ